MNGPKEPAATPEEQQEPFTLGDANDPASLEGPGGWGSVYDESVGGVLADVDRDETKTEKPQ
ncbi:MAG TPA: hypothetical protein VGG39_28585 [Polyangiaceae bacterium]|jgi:hypothetical protein